MDYRVTRKLLFLKFVILNLANTYILDSLKYDKRKEYPFFSATNLIPEMASSLKHSNIYLTLINNILTANRRTEKTQ